MKRWLWLTLALFLILGAAAAAEAQNVLKNPTFDNAAVSPWTGGGFSTEDALGLSGSGSVQRGNSSSSQFTTVSIVSECFSVTGGRVFERAFDYRLDATAGISGRAALNVVWYTDANCTGFPSTTGSTGGTAIGSVWNRVIDSPVTAPSNAVSANVRLDLVKTQAGGSISARFDNVVLRPSGTCANLPDALCITGHRFRVEATWQSSTAAGAARSVRLTNDTGYLWFFSPENVEAVVKVLDGCAVNNRYWVFMGGLTDVTAAITITDVKTGAVKTYHSALGEAFRPIQDTNAFATCP
jgi:hypothetical protein